jgi:hypothetical protein
MPRLEQPYRSDPEDQEVVDWHDEAVRGWFAVWRLTESRRDSLLTGRPDSLTDDLFVVDRIHRVAARKLVEAGLLEACGEGR